MRDRHDAIPRRRRACSPSKGYASASITDIAQTAEHLGWADLQVHFDDKRDLLERVLTRCLRAQHRRARGEGRTGKDIRGAALRAGERAPATSSSRTSTSAACSSRKCAPRRLSRLAIQQLNRRYTPILIKIVDTGLAMARSGPTSIRAWCATCCSARSSIPRWRHVNGSQPLDVERMRAR